MLFRTFYANIHLSPIQTQNRRSKKATHKFEVFICLHYVYSFPY